MANNITQQKPNTISRSQRVEIIGTGLTAYTVRPDEATPGVWWVHLIGEANPYQVRITRVHRSRLRPLEASA